MWNKNDKIEVRQKKQRAIFIFIFYFLPNGTRLHCTNMKQFYIHHKLQHSIRIELNIWEWDLQVIAYKSSCNLHTHFIYRARGKIAISRFLMLPRLKFLKINLLIETVFEDQSIANSTLPFEFFSQLQYI